VESGGGVFEARRLAAETREAKLAATVAARRVALKAHPAPCQVCDCLPDADGGRGRLSCHKCILPEIDIVLSNWRRYN